jgi:hypothetical protein
MVPLLVHCAELAAVNTTALQAVLSVFSSPSVHEAAVPALLSAAVKTGVLQPSPALLGVPLFEQDAGVVPAAWYTGVLQPLPASLSVPSVQVGSFTTPELSQDGPVKAGVLQPSPATLTEPPFEHEWSDAAVNTGVLQSLPATVPLFEQVAGLKVLVFTPVHVASSSVAPVMPDAPPPDSVHVAAVNVLPVTPVQVSASSVAPVMPDAPPPDSVHVAAA